MRRVPDALPRLLVACGLAAPVQFLFTLLLLGAMYPDYAHAAHVMSRLGAVDAPHGWAMNLFGFGLLGVLLIMAGIGWWTGARPGPGSRTDLGVAAGLAAAGVGFLLVAAVPCDPGCGPGPNDRLHDTVAAVPVLGFGLATLAWAWGEAQAGRRRRAGAAVALLGLASASGAAYLATSGSLEGAFQRGALAPALAWLAWAAWLRLRRVAPAEAASPGSEGATHQRHPDAP